jgi:hypothetical protein
MKSIALRIPMLSRGLRPAGLARGAMLILLSSVAGSGLAPRRVEAQEPAPGVIDLTLERMVELSLSSSYQIRRLNLEIQRDQYSLKAQQARLKSSVDLDLTVPAFSLTSEPKWNSDLQKNEIIQENTRLWEGEISIRQPIILFGYPTNGYLSFNNRMYRYNQISDEGVSEIDYYNRSVTRRPSSNPTASRTPWSRRS